MGLQGMLVKATRGGVELIDLVGKGCNLGCECLMEVLLFDDKWHELLDFTSHGGHAERAGWDWRAWCRLRVEREFLGSGDACWWSRVHGGCGHPPSTLGGGGIVVCTAART